MCCLPLSPSPVHSTINISLVEFLSFLVLFSPPHLGCELLQPRLTSARADPQDLVGFEGGGSRCRLRLRSVGRC